MLKLYRVVCQGMRSSHGTAYVLAANSDEAYQTVRTDLDKRGLGFSRERELHSVELIADNSEYPECGVRVYA